tara:strand:- start:85 stop:660 length:576 start_codon:yes stop_codon:yes gene_type:complete
MIKLKDILAESTKIELHKVITDKTEPAFMTEEQWAKKWSNNSIINETAFSKKQLLLMEKTMPSGVWAKVRTALLKFVATNFMTRLPDGQQKVFLKFLKTGKISKSQAKPIYTSMLLGIKGMAVPAAAIAFMVAGFHWLWLPILWWTGAAILDKPGRYLLTKAGMKDTGEKFGVHKDLETAKAYFKKKSIFK